ncbi:alpha/beta hydrolase [Streptomyces alfalfae]
MYQSGNACVNRHLEAYLLKGRVPARDASCAPRREPEPQTAERAARPAEAL